MVTRGSTALTVIDPDRLAVDGTLELGLVPDELAVSRALGLVAAAAGQRLTLAPLAGGAPATIELGRVADRIQLSPDGRMLATVASAAGVVTFVDLATRRPAARVALPGPIADFVFSRSGDRLYVARHDRLAIDAIDLRGRSAAVWAADAPGNYVSLLRSPDGRHLVARRTTGIIDWIDPETGRADASSSAAGDPGPVAMTGSGRFVLAGDRAHERLALLAADTLAIAGSASAPPEIHGISAAWFDLVGFATSAASPQLYIYGLEPFRAEGTIHLAGAPRDALVTSDGATLFLIIPDERAVEAVDARLRRPAGIVRLDAIPEAVATGAAYALCH